MIRDLITDAISFLAVSAFIIGFTVFATVATAQGDKRAMQSGLPTMVEVFHDDERGVTCWVYAWKGISCLPDAQIGGGAV